MLVLTRKSGETIHIGDDIVLKVSEISGNRVKVCIDAPKVLRILRGEVADQMEVSSVEETVATASQGKSSRRSLVGSQADMNAVAK